MKRFFFFLIFLLLFNILLKAQNNKEKRDKIIEKYIEYIGQSSNNENVDYSNLFDELLQIADNPLNINTVTAEEFQKLMFFNEIQIQNIITYRILNGDFLTLYELRQIPSINIKEIKTILPFLTVQKIKNKTIEIPKFDKGKHEVLVRYARILEQKKGYSPIEKSKLLLNPNARYVGNNFNMYVRYKYNIRDKFKISLVGEQDAGEYFFKKNNATGFDFYSGSISYKGKNWLKQIVLGDFQIQFGEGLILWSGYASNKNSNVLNITRVGNKIKPNQSANESVFLRGGAVSMQFKNIELTSFFSTRKLDATINQYSNTEGYIFERYSSISNTGLHRTISEINKKKSLRQNLFGFHLEYSQRNFLIGYSQANYQYNIQSDTYEKPYQYFLNKNKNYSNYGLNFKYIVGNILFFGEYGLQSNFSNAYIIGSKILLNERLKLALLHRNFNPDYFAYYSNSFSETASTTNEKGIYVGMETLLNQYFTLSAYLDLFQFDWLRYATNSLSRGNDGFVELNYDFSNHMNGYFRWKREEKQKNISEQNYGNQKITNYSIEKFRLQNVYKVSNQIEFQHRIEFSTYKIPKQLTKTGIYFSQDLKYTFKNKKNHFAFRLAVFDIKDYNARIYAYENDVLHYFYIPSFNGSGIRAYLVLKYSPFKFFDLWFKVGRTTYTETNTIGTGLEMINGSGKTNIRLQIRYQIF